MSDRGYTRFQKSGNTFWDFLEKLKDIRLEQIRRLTISKYHVFNDSYTINRICRIFPSIERLNVSIERMDNLIQFINSLNCLLSASFYLESNKDSIMDDIEKSNLSSFTYRLDGSSLHLWMKKEVRIKYIKILSLIFFFL